MTFLLLAFLFQIKNCSIVIGGSLSGGVIGILVVGVVIPLALCVLGFTCWGVMAGSAAACCQSNIGNVPSGSCFSCMQSLGAGGGGCLVYLSIACIGILPGLYFGGHTLKLIITVSLLVKIKKKNLFRPFPNVSKNFFFLFLAFIPIARFSLSFF